MALEIHDRVKETTTTTGTGTYTLAGAVTGFETFTANLDNSDTTYYACTDNTDFEVGLGTFTSSGTTLARTTILASSNSNNAVNWSSGTRTIFMTYPADKAVFEDASGHVSLPHDLFIAGGLIDLKNDGGAVSQIKFYCESSNAHAQTLIGAPHAQSATNTLTLPDGSNGTLLSTVSTATVTNKTLTTPTINGATFGSANLATASNGDINLAPNGTGKVVIKGNTNQGKIVLNCENNSHGQTIISAPHSESADNTLTLPSTGGDARLVSTASTATLTNKTLTSPKINEDVAVTSTATELNILDGVTSTTAELNILDGVTASAADINLIDGITNGTVIASKAIITDSNKDITGGRNITISGELDAATLDISGDADIDGTLEADAITVGGTALSEVISDTTGAMFSSNTETGVTVTYQDADNTIDVAIDAAQTTIESVKNTSLVIGRDNDNLIKFDTDNVVIFKVADDDTIRFKASGEIEATSLDISGDADIDGTLEADAITVNGTALNTVIADEATALAIALG
jgi:cytoskeletal protein CcmA (bactofilin family)